MDDLGSMILDGLDSDGVDNNELGNSDDDVDNNELGSSDGMDNDGGNTLHVQGGAHNFVRHTVEPFFFHSFFLLLLNI